MKGVLDLIDLKKLARNTKQNAVIDFPVKDIKDIFLGKDNRWKLIIKVTPLNGELLGLNDLKKISNGIANAINPLRKLPFGIYVASSIIDSQKNIANITDKMKLLEGAKYEILESELERFKELREKNTQKPNFFIVIQSSKKEYHDAYQELVLMADDIHKELSIVGHFSQHLEEDDIKKTFYNLTHKNTAKDREYQRGWGLNEVFPNTTTKDKDGKHVIIDDYYYRSYYFASMPTSEVDYRWFRKLIDIKGDFFLSFVFNPKKRDNKSDKSFNLVSKLNKADSAINNSLISKKSASKKNATYDRFAEIMADEEEWIYDTSILITLGNMDKDALRNTSTSFIRKFKRFKATQIQDYNFKPFYVSLPLLYNPEFLTKQFRWNFATSDIGRMCLFDSADYMEEKGTVWGKNIIPSGKKVMERGIIVADRQDRNRYDNGHLTIIGTTGSGKSVLLMALARAMYPYYDYTVMFDIKGDFFFPFAKRYDFTKAAGNCINPLHIYGADRYSDLQLEEVVDTKISDFISFLQWTIPEIGKYEENIIDEDLQATYKSVHFYSERNIPTLSDYDNILKKHIFEEDRSAKEKEVRQNIRVYIRDMVSGRNSHLFNGQNTIEFNEFTVYGLNTIGNEDTRNSAYDISFRNLDNFVRSFGTNSGTTFHLIGDEIHNIIHPNNPKATTDMIKAVKEHRGFGADWTLATQEFSDLSKVEGGESIWTLSAFRVILKIVDSDIEAMDKLYKFTESEKELIKGSEKSAEEMIQNPLDFKDKGKGLLFIGRQRFGFQKALTAAEMEIIIPHVYEQLYKKPSRYKRIV